MIGFFSSSSSSSAKAAGTNEAIILKQGGKVLWIEKSIGVHRKISVYFDYVDSGSRRESVGYACRAFLSSFYSLSFFFLLFSLVL